ncbi:MAG: hypothetical protein RBS73_08930 [Prolixibacteraceae bacterium]|jgi:hypothetical protein|nr:hypothetical protein [Prolixibacteraceae bacterium]
MKTRKSKRLLQVIVLFSVIIPDFIFAQNVGDYGSSASGNWGTDGTIWIVCTAAGTWDGAITATSVPDETTNVWIRSGHTVYTTLSGKNCKNLTIEPGAKLWGNSGASSSKYFNIYGSTVRIDGTFGGESDAASIQASGTSPQTLTLTGSGTCHLNRLYPENANTTFIFDIDVSFHYEGVAMYANSEEGTTFTINSGKKLTFSSVSHISGNTSSTTRGRGYTLNIYGTLEMNNGSVLNMNALTSNTTNLHVYNGGVLNLYSTLQANSTSYGTVNITVDEGGAINGLVGSMFDLSNATTTVNGIVDLGGTSTSTRSLGAASIGSTGKMRLADANYPTGVVTLNSGSTVEYDGDVAFSLPASPATYGNLLISSSSEITVDNSVTAENMTINSSASVSVASGQTVSLTGDLALKSDASATASLINNGTINVVGTTSAECYMTGNVWYVVAPIAEGGNISTFVQAAANAIPANGSNYGMMDYNETTNSWNSYFTSGTTGNLGVGRGYCLRRSSNGTVTYSGTLSGGTKTVTLTKEGEGWNCIGNPYPSAIAINSASPATENFIAHNNGSLDASYACVYVWDDNSKTYKIKGNVQGAYGSRELDQNVLQAGQGFFVKAKEAGTSVVFNSDMQVHSNSAILKSAPAPWPGFELLASSEKTTTSTVLIFNEKMTVGLDVAYDAGLLRGSSGLEIYTRLAEDNGVDFAVQCLPETYKSLVVPLGVENKTGGEITFRIKPLGRFNLHSVTLEDKTANTFTDLTGGATYRVAVAAGKTGIGRFYVHIDHSTTGVALLENKDASSLKVYQADGQIRIIGELGVSPRAHLFNIAGCLLGTYRLQQGNCNNIPASGLAPGVYFIQIEEQSGHRTVKVAVR